MARLLSVLVVWTWGILSLLAVCGSAAGEVRHTFEKQTLSDRFYAEGAAIADIDADGHADVVAGPYWYAGPEFQERFAYREAQEYRIAGYSDNFLTFTHDINHDGHIDILVIPWPGEQGYWFENPGRELREAAKWPRHPTIERVDGESPDFVDITGDGEPEMVCIYQGSFVYAHPRKDDPTAPWEVVRLTPDRGYQRYTHGQGVSDIDGDGRMDLLETNGWWQQPQGWQPGQSFQFHPTKFADAGGAQMFAYDVDGDGDGDVISSQNAHAYGLSWFEQQIKGGEREFVEHPVMTEDPTAFDHGLAFSQLHALALADMDGDGVKDIVTGKRYWAHGGNDPGAHELPVLYWFQCVRTEDGVQFVPHLIDSRSGVGTQVTVGDVDADKDLDVVVANKLGVFVLRHNVEAAADDADVSQSSDRPQIDRVTDRATDRARDRRTERPIDGRIGGDAFASHVRPTEHLSPEEERRQFVLPSGFEIQLVAAEPDIAKPLNMAFDARGRLWVTDTVEYPYAAPPDRKGRDSIKILEDTDGDGQADKVTTFADGLNIPMGLYPYRDGVIAFSIPNIWFLRDTDGDDVADERAVLYGPIGYERDVHGLCNGFRRGFDGWLYACHGFNNHTEVAGRDGHAITMQSGNTFRMRLDGGRVEHYTWGQVNPFGMAFDALGNIFTADCHTKPVTLLLEGGYYESFGKPHDGLGFVPSVMDHLHGSTAIGGIALYDSAGSSGRFPADYENSTFGGNVMTSRVNRNTLVYEGGSVRAVEEPDFVISGDPWFRPADLRVGPDGALYIADFYNKIIGHYEVPLDHAGRDRTSGRIWRVVYRGRDGNPPVPSLKDADLTGKSIQELLDSLDSANLTQRMLITDRLVDHFGSAALVPAKKKFNATNVPTTRVHAMWVLFRLRALGDEELTVALADESPLVRVHALRAVREMDPIPAGALAWIPGALRDSDARVRRAAAMAATRVRDERLIDPLMDLYFATPERDVHLRHAVRMALREHLRRDDWLGLAAIDSLDKSRGELIADICLALDSLSAADYVLVYVQRHSIDDRQRLARYVEYAAGRIGRDRLSELAQLAQDRFGDDPEFQLQLLEAIRRGLVRRGEGADGSVKAWAASLARQLLHLDQLGGGPIAWDDGPVPGTPARGNPWVVQPRPSADGNSGALFYCSLPRGEAWTGIYRSAEFPLPQTFSFYIAGHAGFPANKPHEKNVVRLVDAATGDVLRESLPPRNDTAQRVDWDTSEWAGRPAFLELVDGDTGQAYAWLAVGRFSVDALNPSRVPLDRRAGADLAGKFELVELREALGRVLRDSLADRETSQAVAEGLVALGPDARLGAVSEVLGIESCSPELRQKAAEVVLDRDAAAAEDLLAEVMVVASAAQQRRLAERLCGGREGIASLVNLVEAGRASPQLLLQPSIAPRIDAAGDTALRQRARELASLAPASDDSRTRLIEERLAAFTQGAADVAAGAAVFREQCANCHQIGGEGSKVGPQLDGIGGRGLARVLEDVLDPNRNVDVAFRTTTITTTTGRIVTGILLREEGNNLVLADQEGKEMTIPKDEIDEQHPSALSLMPANFGESLTKEQLNDLTAFLLEQRQ